MMNVRFQSASFAVLCAATVAVESLGVPTTAAEPKWQSVLDNIDPSLDRVAGRWEKSENSLTVAAESGARLAIPISPKGEYDVRTSFTRKTGRHSIGLIVVHNGRQVVFEVDAWGGHLGGFQNVGDRSIQDNPTRAENVTLGNGKRHTLTVEVRRDRLRGLLDDREISVLETDGANLSLPDLWTLPNRQSLGLVSWDSETTFHTLEVRPLGTEPLTIARATPAARPATTPRPMPSTPSNPPVGGGNARGKRVLLVIANYHFFYREYGDPRAEFERAGIKVTVAAGRKGACYPHRGSGEGGDGGVVQADIALKDARASDYDAILFSGGWGASAYQFAFPGTYNDRQYNGDRAVKAEVNRLINEFLEADKYVCALCNAVSVLAWARVDGKSPLDGKHVCAPTRQAASGIYDGRQAQPSCRWHPEKNGAILSPAGAIGDPGSAHDDVIVDGHIITGEDDPSAREMGRRIVQVLSN